MPFRLKRADCLVGKTLSHSFYGEGGRKGDFGRLWATFSAKRKGQLALLVLLMLLSGFAEIFSLGALIPFLAAMVAPEKSFAHSFVQSSLKKIPQEWFLIGNPVGEYLLAPLNLAFVFALGFILAALLAGIIRLSLIWTSVHFVASIGTDLATEIFRRSLYQSYKIHTTRNSNELISGLTSKIAMLIVTINSLLTLIASIIIIIFLVGALLYINPQVTLASGAALGGSYVIIFFISKKKLALNSVLLNINHDKMIKSIQEGIGGIRDILLGGTQIMFTEIYRQADASFRQSNANIAIIGLSPRNIMETLGMILFALLAMILSIDSGGLASALPTLGAFALGVQRLLPALQQGYQAWTYLPAYKESNKKVISLLNQQLPDWVDNSKIKIMSFKKEIRFIKVQFRYTEKSKWIINNLSFKIPKGARVAIVGETGSGKSTVLDLLMGLLSPTNGKILVDGIELTEKNIKSWQKNIAHVPQSIHLCDCSILQNIAFGVSQPDINLKNVENAAKHAQIDEFINKSVQKYNQTIGERGIRLSGGQRQRIGIARAFYKNCDVIILDEATNALDAKTEKQILNSIHLRDKSKTIFYVSHNKEIIKKCNFIINLKNKK